MIIVLCICIIIFFVIILPIIDNCNMNNMTNICNKIEKLTPTLVDKKLCSKSCCHQNQWPVPFLGVDTPNNNYVANNYSCNFQDGSGCPCLTQQDLNNLSSKSGNLLPP